MSSALSDIDRYFNGELTAAEKLAFENRCLSDPAFAKLVAFYVSLHDQLKEQWAAQRRQEFAKLEASDTPAENGFNARENQETVVPYQREGKEVPTYVENQKGKALESLSSTEEIPSTEAINSENANGKKGKPRTITLWQKLAVAAAVLGIIALGMTWYLQSNEPGSDPVVANNKVTNTKPGTLPDNLSAQKEIALDTATNPDNIPDVAAKERLDKAKPTQLARNNFTADRLPKKAPELLEEAFERYGNGNYKEASREYEEAITVVESLETRTSEDQHAEAEKQRILFYAHYYNGLSYLAQGNAAKAITELKAINKSPDPHWQGKVQWYLALAYLRTGETIQAAALLKQVAGNTQAEEYQQKAIQLRKELNVLLPIK